jgi:DNA-binding response OmpR family regulator/two-component sensor histidine kinase
MLQLSIEMLVISIRPLTRGDGLKVVFAFLFIFLLIQYVRHIIAEHKSQERLRFFIQITHEILTPLSLVKAPLNELETLEALSGRGKKLLTVATENADKLFVLITQLLDLQKVDMNVEQLNITKQDLFSYIQEKIIAFRTIAKQKGIELHLDANPDFQEVWFDRDKMDKIINNLLSNAIKYTDEGAVSVILKEGVNKWSIEIQDTGIGIPKKEQKYIFRRYYRAGNAVNSNESGSGIGLLLTKKLVQLLQGDILFYSTENIGTSFVLTFPSNVNASLPAGKDFSKPATAMEDTSDTFDISPEKNVLLLAEDNNDMREYLTESLSNEYQVISVSDGEKLLSTAKEVNPDIIVSDVLMPGLRGDEVCRILKSSMETSHIPFILLSALSEKENVIFGLEAGANDYIIKPFDFSVLKARIRNIIQSREQLRKTVLSNEPDLEDVDYVNQLDKYFLDKVIQVIEAELGNSEFSINEFCRMLGMSRTSVYNKMKTLTDQAPNDFIRIIRLNKSKELLKSKIYTIAEVSDRVGFSDPKYFSTSFKKQFGVSPSKLL